MYNHVLFIAYAINTTSPKSRPYGGAPNEAADWKKRVEIMGAAIDKARDEIARLVLPMSHAKCLRVFMAPEAFFRGPIGAYSLEAYHDALAALKVLVSDSKWDDWVFAMGSIFAYAKDETSPSHPYLAFNLAPVLNGGAAGNLQIVMKEHLAPMQDFSPGNHDNILTANNVQYLPPVNAPGPGREGGAHGHPGGIFTMSEVTFGLELCKDHAQGRLAASPPSRGEDDVQIHLVSSAGISVNRDKVIAMDGGYVFHVDGSSSQFGVDTIGGLRQPKRTSVALYRLDKENDFSRIKPEQKLLLTTEVDSYFQDPGAIFIYPVQSMPAARKRI